MYRPSVYYIPSLYNLSSSCVQVYYPLFLQSDQYRKYISELLYMMEPVRTDHHHNDATTQHFISTQQQAIASSNGCKQQVLDELDDPSELWRRPHSVWVYIIKLWPCSMVQI